MNIQEAIIETNRQVADRRWEEDDYSADALQVLLDEITRLTSLIQRMADIFNDSVEKWVEDIDGNFEKWKCAFCEEKTTLGDNGWECNHASDCPVTRWQELKKEMSQ